MLKNLVVAAAICTVYSASCLAGTPSTADLKAVTSAQLAGYTSKTCLPLELESGYHDYRSGLPFDDSFVIPDTADDQGLANYLDTERGRAKVLQASGYLTSEKATYATATSASTTRVTPATRFRLTGKARGEIFRSDRHQPGLDYCVQVGNWVVTETSQRTLTVSLKWRDTPQWLRSPEAQLVFARKLDYLKRQTPDGLSVVLPEHADDATAGTPEALITAAQLYLAASPQTHARLPLPYDYSDNLRYKAYLTDGLYFSTTPRYTPYGATAEQRSESLQMLNTLVAVGAMTKTTTHRAMMSTMSVYRIADGIAADSDVQGITLNLGGYALAGKPDSFATHSGIVEASVAYTLRTPPAWLVSAAKTSAYFRALLSGGHLYIIARLEGTHYVILNVKPEDWPVSQQISSN